MSEPTIDDDRATILTWWKDGNRRRVDVEWMAGALQVERDRLMRMLCDLTPGGSEFFENPERCAVWIKDRLSFAIGYCSQAKVDRDAEQQRADAAEAELARLRPVVAALVDVAAERARQDAKWGEQNHIGLYWLGILTEELGEMAKALITDNAGAAEYRAELVHVAAVAVAAIESLDRQLGGRAAEVRTGGVTG